MFKTILNLDVIDTHTEGEPTRIIFWNNIPTNVKSVKEMYEYFKSKYDHVRKLMLLEPRGHSSQFGAVILPPINQGSNFSLLFLTTSGYLDMCGHATIGVSTVLTQVMKLRQ